MVLEGQHEARGRAQPWDELQVLQMPAEAYCHLVIENKFLGLLDPPDQMDPGESRLDFLDHLDPNAQDELQVQGVPRDAHHYLVIE